MDDRAARRFPQSCAATPLRAVTNVEGVTLRTIARSEVAAFAAEELDRRAFVRQAAFIGHD